MPIDFEDIDPAQFRRGFKPDKAEGEEDQDQRFRHQEEQKHAAPVEEGPQPPVGEMVITSMMMGAMAVDANNRQGSTIKSFLTKSSSLLTASEGVGDLVPDLHYDAVDEEKEAERLAFLGLIMNDTSDLGLQAAGSKALAKQVMLARMLLRLSVANVARHDGLLPRNLTVT
jgi:hypothetical protein